MVKWTTENTILTTWFERDRKHVDLQRADTGATIVEWWDEAVDQAEEDGFLSAEGFVLGRMVRSEPLHQSAVEYANDHGLTGETPVTIHAVEDEEHEDDGACCECGAEDHTCQDCPTFSHEEV